MSTPPFTTYRVTYLNDGNGYCDPNRTFVEEGGFARAPKVYPNAGYRFLIFELRSGVVDYFDPYTGLLVGIRSNVNLRAYFELIPTSSFLLLMV